MEEEDVKQRVRLGVFVAAGLLLFLVAVFYLRHQYREHFPGGGVVFVFRRGGVWGVAMECECP